MVSICADVSMNNLYTTQSQHHVKPRSPGKSGAEAWESAAYAVEIWYLLWRSDIFFCTFPMFNPQSLRHVKILSKRKGDNLPASNFTDQFAIEFDVAALGNSHQSDFYKIVDFLNFVFLWFLNSRLYAQRRKHKESYASLMLETLGPIVWRCEVVWGLRFSVSGCFGDIMMQFNHNSIRNTWNIRFKYEKIKVFF